MPEIANPHNLPIITCVSCGIETVVGRQWASKRKFCKLCQVIRDGERFLASERECTRCGNGFWPIRNGKGWDKCPDCASFWTLKDLMDAPDCNVCGRRQPPAAGLDKTCLSCVSSSKELRDGYIVKLKEIVANRVNSFIENSL